jgi:lipopolysaccharide export LptBFGC system permease protein LptF
MSEENATSKFIDELKAQYDKEFESRQSIDDKSNSTTSTAGTVTGLLFGFGTLLISNINASYVFLYYTISLFIIAIIANIITVFLCIWISRVREYRLVMSHNIFFRQEGQPERIRESGRNYNEYNIDEFKNAKIPDFQNLMIHEYLYCNKFNNELNARKAIMLYYAQIIFLFSLLILPILVILVLHAFISRATHT